MAFVPVVLACARPPPGPGDPPVPRDRDREPVSRAVEQFRRRLAGAGREELLETCAQLYEALLREAEAAARRG